jgi:hypothetical protein
LEHEFYFPFHIWDVILPIDEHIFQDGYCTTNQTIFGGFSHDHIAPGATDSMGSGSSVLASLAAPMAQRAGRWQRAVVATPGVRCWGWLGGAGSGYQWIGLTANLQETIDFVMKYGCFL